MQELGYIPNAIARSMRTQSTQVIGFMADDFSNPLFASIAMYSEELLQDSGYSLIMSNSKHILSAELRLLRVYQQRKVDGLIIAPSSETNSEFNKAMSEASCPIVILDRESPIPTDMVMTDHAAGIKLATEYLIDLGHRKIGLITAGTEISPGRERFKGYQAAFKAKGVKINHAFIRRGNLSAEYGYDETVSLMNLRERPTAMIAGGNQLLEGILKALNQANVKIPKDLSLISCDDTVLSQLVNPPITVVSRDLRHIGRTAANMIIKRLKGEGTMAKLDPKTVHLPTELILRKSCAPLR